MRTARPSGNVMWRSHAFRSIAMGRRSGSGPANVGGDGVDFNSTNVALPLAALGAPPRIASSEFVEAPPHPDLLPLKGEKGRRRRAHLTSTHTPRWRCSTSGWLRTD